MILALALLSFTLCLGSLAACLLVAWRGRQSRRDNDVRSPAWRGRQSRRVNAAYIAAALSATLWTFCQTLLQLAPGPAAPLLPRLAALGWIAGSAAAFLFAYFLFCSILARPPSAWVTLLAVLPALLFWLVIAQDQQLLLRPRLAALANPWVLALALWLATVSILMVYFTAAAWQKARLNRARRMVRLALLPSALVGPAALLTDLLLPLLGLTALPPLAHLLYALYAIFVGAAVLRFHILDIEPAFVIEQLFFDITDLVILTDLDGIIRRSNQSLSQQTRLFPASLTGQPIQQVLPGFNLREQIVYRAPQKSMFETELALPGGERIPVRAAVSVVSDLHADPVGYYFLLSDLRPVRKIAQYADELEESNRKLEEISLTDPLTGVWNRAKYNQMLQAEFERFRRYGEPFAILLVDIDKFKIINDTLGHSAGDQVLKEIVAKVHLEIRSTDIFARWGGDEFAILTPHLDTAGVALVAERIRRAVASVRCGEHPVSASIGLAVATHMESIPALFERADNAVYRAKDQGGNCFVLG